MLYEKNLFSLKSLRMARALERGFVITVEAGLYFIPELMDMWQVENKFSNFINNNALHHFGNFGGFRIEDDVLITPTGSRILGKPLAKTTQQIELLCGWKKMEARSPGSFPYTITAILSPIPFAAIQPLVHAC